MHARGEAHFTRDSSSGYGYLRFGPTVGTVQTVPLLLDERSDELPVLGLLNVDLGYDGALYGVEFEDAFSMFPPDVNAATTPGGIILPATAVLLASDEWLLSFSKSVAATTVWLYYPAVSWLGVGLTRRNEVVSLSFRGEAAEASLPHGLLATTPQARLS